MLNVREGVEKAIMALVKVTHVVRLYYPGHELIKKALDSLTSVLNEILSDRQEVTIGVLGSELVFDKMPFYEVNNQIQGFVNLLKNLKIEKITFTNGVDKKELIDFAAILTINPKNIKKMEDIEKLMLNKGIQHITVGKIGLRKEDERALDASSLKSAIKKSYQEGLEFLKNALADVKKDKPLDIKFANRLINDLINRMLMDKNLIIFLTLVRSHSEHLFVHDLNVTIFTLLQAHAMGIEEGQLKAVGMSALLHDAGKLTISEEILKKKEKLTKEEKEEIELHPVKGGKLLLETPGVDVMAAQVAFEHHMRFDMSGYPRKHYGKKTNPITMMVTIADVYDAIRSDRPYHAGMLPENTYDEMIKLSGTFFNPQLLEHFFRIIGVYPPGTFVELDTGEIALVVKESLVDMRRPQVEILYDKDGKKFPEPLVCNL